MCPLQTPRKWYGRKEHEHIEEKKLKIEELCHNLNNTRRVGFSASPMEIFFNRPVKGHLTNQFIKENGMR